MLKGEAGPGGSKCRPEVRRSRQGSFRGGGGSAGMEGFRWVPGADIAGPADDWTGGSGRHGGVDRDTPGRDLSSGWLVTTCPEMRQTRGDGRG